MALHMPILGGAKSESLNPCDDTAGQTRTCVAGLETLLISALSQVVSLFVDDDSSADGRQRRRFNEGDLVGDHINFSYAVGSGADVPQVPGVTAVLAFSWGPVGRV